jgi:hypothetical protein
MLEKIINNFNDIIISDKKTLIICDIDDTLIKFKNIEQYRIFGSLVKPLPTDIYGFISMLKKVKINNGKIIFLTARISAAEKITRQQFSDIGLNYNDFNIYYTNGNMEKGYYIMDNIELSNYDEIIFIDDNDVCLISVINLFPDIKCYKFDWKY